VISSETTDQSARTRLGAILLIALLAIAAGGKSILFDTLDPDSFWHLRVADQLMLEGIHPLVDTISYASLKQPWTPYSWLAELTMKSIWDQGGVRAVVATEALLIATFFTFIALAAFARSGKYFTSSILIFLAIVLCLPYLSFRPVTMCLTLLAICWWLLVRDQQLEKKSNVPLKRGTSLFFSAPFVSIKKGDSHYFRIGGTDRNRAFCDQKKTVAVTFFWPPSLVWLIVPLTAVNINLHFFALFSPLWIGCLLIWNGRYLPLFIATSLACLATPMLPGMVSTIVHYQFGDPMLHAGVISEFAPFCAGPVGIALATILAILLVCALRRRGELSRGEWIALLISTALLIKLGRFAPLFAIVGIPLLSVTAPTLRDRVLGKPVILAMLSLCVTLAVLKITLALPARDLTIDRWINRHGPDVPGYPVEAADFVAKNITPETHRLINEFTWGGYLTWRLGDRFQVLMDGRTQLYAPAFWESIYLRPKDQLAKTMSHVKADAAILPASQSRLHDSLIALGWRRVFCDRRAEVLVPPTVPVASIDDAIR
jgi:hypothetical protein